MTQNEFQPYVRYFDNDEVEFFEMISTMFTNGIGPLSLLRSAYRDPTDFAKFSTKADREVNPFQNLVTLTKTLRFNRKAEDSRDRIFALLGLVEPIQRVIADYGKPVNQVYTETTRELILLAQDLAEFWWISHNDEDGMFNALSHLAHSPMKRNLNACSQLWTLSFEKKSRLSIALSRKDAKMTDSD
jgi:hypothetical protein